MSSSDRPVIVDITDGVLRLTLRNPGRRNAISEAMLEALAEEIDHVSNRPDVRVVVLQGADGHFCAGADLKAKDGVNNTGLRTLDAANAMITALVNLDRPTISAVSGTAAGAGCSIALACDLVVARESASFLLAFTRRGIMPDSGATALVAANIGRARAMRMALLAEPVDARTALEWGLVSHVFTDDEYDASLESLVTTLATGPTKALVQTKLAISAAALSDFDGALSRERVGQSSLLATNDLQEGVRSFLEKRPAEYTGS